MNTHGRQWTLATLVPALAMIVACGGDASVTDPGVTTPPPPPPPTRVLLKDILVEHLPSPYYHFDYDTAGRIAHASFASATDDFTVNYIGERIKELTNNGGIGERDRIVYAYDDAGRVGGVRYVDRNGVTYTVVVYTYDGDKLTGVERSQRVPGSLIIDKTMTLAYYPDGNLQTLTEHRPAIAGLQDETTNVTRFEEYDTGTNVDGFGLIHDDFFDHFVLLPGVQLQRNNPRRETRTGDGLTYSVEYTYGYDTDGKRPLTKRGDLVITGGGTVGLHVPIGSAFTYY
jgi:hypothetical protein